MSDLGSNLSFPSPSASPTLTSNITNDQNRSNEIAFKWTQEVETAKGNEELVEVEEGEEEEENLNENLIKKSSIRGRTDRKRSNSTQLYICVIVWIIKPTNNNSSKEFLKEVQEIRRKFDNAHKRWEPHVTLIPPFIVPFKQSKDAKNQEINLNSSIYEFVDPYQVMQKLCFRIKNLISNFKISTIEFDQISKFQLRRYDSFHLKPNENSNGLKELKNLQFQLANALPEAFEFSRNGIKKKDLNNHYKKFSNFDSITNSGLPGNLISINDDNNNHHHFNNNFKPHLTLGQASNFEKQNEIEFETQKLLQKFSSLETLINSIQFMFKPINRSGPYDLYQEFQLN